MSFEIELPLEEDEFVDKYILVYTTIKPTEDEDDNINYKSGDHNKLFESIGLLEAAKHILKQEGLPEEGDET